MPTFILEDGISTWVWRACRPLRIRVSMSAIGSLMFILSPLPAGLHHARQLAARRALAEADAAQAELPDERPRAPAQEAAVVGLHFVLGRPLGLFDHAFLGHECVGILLRPPGRASRVVEAGGGLL